jgi:hypothetical protein
MESGLIFNQLICEFESRRPCQTRGRMLSVTTSLNVPSRSFPCPPRPAWVVAQLAEHRTVTAAIEGSTPFDPPKNIGDCRLPIADCFVGVMFRY